MGKPVVVEESDIEGLFTDIPRKQEQHQGRNVSNELLLSRRRGIELEFNARRTDLINYLGQSRDYQDESYHIELKKRIVSLRIVAANLLRINSYLAPSTINARQIRSVLLICQIAEGEKRSFSSDEEAQYKPSYTTGVSHRIRQTTGQVNWFRLFGLRLKRFFEALAPVVKSIKGFEDFVKDIDKLNPILSYVAWLYYIPRFLTNLIILFKHTVPGWWMGEEERKIHWRKRLDSEWSRRWFEILNDGVWCLVGLLTCFVLSSPHGMLLTVGLYLFDVAMAVMNYYKQIKQYTRSISLIESELKPFRIQLARLNPSDTSAIETLKEKIKIRETYLDSLLQWKSYEKKRLTQSICVTMGLSIGMGIGAIPIVALLVGATLSGPWGMALPLIAATIVLAVCIAQYITNKQIEKQKPETNIEDMGELSSLQGLPLDENEIAARQRHGFFSETLRPSQHTLRRAMSAPSRLREEDASNDVDLDTPKQAGI